MSAAACAPGPLGTTRPQHTHMHTKTHTCSQLQEAVFYLSGGLITASTHTCTIERQNASRLFSTNNTSIHQLCCIGATHNLKSAHSSIKAQKSSGLFLIEVQWPNSVHLSVVLCGNVELFTIAVIVVYFTVHFYKRKEVREGQLPLAGFIDR